MTFELLNHAASNFELNDQAIIVCDCWRGAMKALGFDDHISPHGLAELLKNTRGGRNLQAIGLEADIRHAAATDRHTIVPELDIPSWRIRAG